MRDPALYGCKGHTSLRGSFQGGLLVKRPRTCKGPCITNLPYLTLLRLSCLYLYNRARYVCFITNLFSKKFFFNRHNFSLKFVSLVTSGVLVELENNQILPFVVLMNPNFGRLINSFLKFSKILSRSIFTTLSLYMFSIAITPVTCILSLFVFQIWIFSFKKVYPIGCP